MSYFIKRGFSASTVCAKQFNIGPDLLAESFTKPTKFRSRKAPNPVIKTEGEDLVFGIHPVTVALSANRRIFHRVYLSEKGSPTHESIEKLASTKNVAIEFVSKQVLDSLVGNAAWNPHQGVALDCGKLPVVTFNNEKEFQLSDRKITMVLVNILDPMNLGAILRSAHFFGCNSVVITSDCSKLSPVVSKASSGALETMQIAVLSPKLLLPFVEWLQSESNKVPAVATAGFSNETENKQNSVLKLSDFVARLQQRTFSKFYILFGNEGRGLPESVCQAANYRVVIARQQSSDCLPIVSSLNVSVAAGIILQTCASVVAKF